MFTNSIDSILKLLALTVFADKRVFADEIDTFINSARNFEAFETSETDLSPAKLLAWFETHRGELKDRLENLSTFEIWVNNILDDLSDHPEKHAILNRMIKIAKADRELHVSEKALIVLTAQRWNINLTI